MKKIPAIRHGIGPSKFILRESEIGKSLYQALLGQGKISQTELDSAFSHQDIINSDGIPLSPHTLVHRIQPVFIYRKPLPEIPVPFSMPIILETDRFVIVDKPPFLASIPRGMHITETALVRARMITGIDTLSPAHRLDRLTSGLLLFTTHRHLRGAYQKLFSEKKISKIYHALAPRPSKEQKFPLEITSRIEKTPGIMRAQEIIGIPNAVTIIDYLGDHPSGYGEYLLKPLTGKTHQLRLHMARIGLAIIGDPLYPVDLHPDSTDFSIPLQLRAHELHFTDPITGQYFDCFSQQKWIL